MAFPVVSRKYRSVWFLGLEVSFRSDYQIELIRFAKRPTVVQPAHDGDSIGTEIASSNFVDKVCGIGDRLGALLFPRCATHKNTRVTLIGKTHQCPKCRQELGIA